jgi:hypothetical protein
MTPAKETLDEVRTTFGVSKERIRQIEEEALQNLDLFYLNGVNILVDRITQDRGGILPFDRLLNLQKSSDDSIRADQHWGMFRISGLLKLMRASEKEDFQVHNDRYLHSALDPDLIDDLTQTLPDIWDEQDEPQKLNQLADELMRRLDDVDPDTLEDRMPMPFEDVVRQLIDLHDDWGLSPFDNWGHQDHKEIEPSTHKDWAYVAMKDLDEPAHKDVIHRKAEEMSNEDLNNRGFYHAIQDMDESVLFEYGNAVYGLEQMKEEHDVKEPTTIIQLNYETLRDDAPQPLKSIIRSVRQQEDYSPSSIRTFLEADPRIVLTEEEDRDIYDLHPKHEQMGKSERGRGKWGGVSTDLQENMAEQVLQKNDNPVPIDRISRQMSIQNDGGPFYTLNLRHVLLNSDDIVHKGENHYALSSNGYRHVTKDEAIEQVFEESGDGPLSKSEIAKRVQEYRRMHDSRVYQTLRKHPDIFSPEKGKYILKEDLLD